MDEMVIVAVCLGLNALFAAFEMAFVSVSRSELRGLAQSGHRDAKKLLALRENPERTLSAIQIGITLVGAIAAAVGGVGAGETIEPYFIAKFAMSERTAELLSVALVVIPITYLSVVVGELVPKTLALRNPLKIVLTGTKFLVIADRVLSPVITLFEWSTKRITQIFFRPLKPTVQNEQAPIEIHSLSPAHRTIMLNMAEIEKKRIRDIYLPWTRVISVERNAATEEITQVFVSSGHTRLPVKEDGCITGLLHTKEFITLKESGEINWQGLIRPVLKVSANDSALGVMRLLQDRRNHMAVVMSPANEQMGIVTLEDILEVVVGDIFDEDDDERVRKVYASKVKARVSKLLVKSEIGKK